jgi:hypothetical protein
LNQQKNLDQLKVSLSVELFEKRGRLAGSQAKPEVNCATGVEGASLDEATRHYSAQLKTGGPSFIIEDANMKRF